MAKQTFAPHDPEHASPPTIPGNRAPASQGQRGMLGCCISHKGLQGLFLMVVCCGAPLLLFLALPALGSALGGRGSWLVNSLALLACPLGMGVMLWFMMRTQQAAARQPAQAARPVLSQEPGSAPAEPQDMAAPRRTSAPVAATLTRPVSGEPAEDGHQTRASYPGTGGHP